MLPQKQIWVNIDAKISYLQFNAGRILYISYGISI